MKVTIKYHDKPNDGFIERQKKIYNDNLEFVARRINANTELKKKTVFILGSLFYINDIVNAKTSTDALSKVDIAGNTILEIVRKIGYWCCVIGCIIDIVKALMQGDTKSIAKIMMKYALAFGALYVFPWILDLIKSIF